MTNREFTVGDLVAYGTNGICTIEEIKMMSLAAGMPEQMYYVLKPSCSKSSTVYVPQDNEKLVSKLRSPMTRDEIEEIISISHDQTLEWSNDRRYRNESFHEILSAGVSKDMLLMIDCIRNRKEKLTMAGKKLPATDSNVLKQAQRLVNEEFSFILGIDKTQVEEYIKEVR